MGGALDGPNADRDVLVSSKYDGSQATPTSLSTQVMMGSTWGLAYRRQTEQIFTSAFFKRHTALGPLGLGGIYSTDRTNPMMPVTTSWLDVATLPGVNVGTNPRAASPNYNLDAAAFGLVGKIGLGDIDISTDEKTLYVMNLNNNGELLIIDIATKTLINKIPVPNPGCASDTDVRPFATKYYNGEVYIGLVCSGQSNGVIGNYYIMKLTGSTFTTVHSASLSYPKGFVHAQYASPPVLCDSWETWTDDFADIHTAGSTTSGPRWCRPQPIFSDIEFDVNGDIILGFMDRTGHQTGYQQRNPANTIIGNGYVGGDILRVDYNPTTMAYTLENNGTTLSGGGCGPSGGGRSQGPGTGEYYCGDRYPVSGTVTHEEISNGGLALLPGKNEVVLTAMDPGTVVFAGGAIFLNNTTGQKDRYIQLYVSSLSDPNTFGKAAGIGDVELMCQPIPIVIGNYAWNDFDGDGVQDPNEMPLGGLNVTLYSASGMVIGMTTTAANGSYSFSSSSLPIHPDSSYVLVFGIGQTMGGTLTLPSGVFQLTSPNTGQGTNPDVNDSDATPNPLFGGLPSISVPPTSMGSNLNFDVGFSLVPIPYDVALIKTPANNTPIKIGDDVTFNITVTNQTVGIAPLGTLDSIIIVDSIPGGYFLNDTTWTSIGSNKVQKKIAGPLAPNGATAMTTITLTVDSDANPNNITNRAEVSSIYAEGETTPKVDIDSPNDSNFGNDPGGVPVIGSTTPMGTDNTIMGENGDEDDSDPATPVLFDLALTKTIATPPTMPIVQGVSTVTYNVTVYNQGNVTATNVDVVDQAPCGLTSATPGLTQTIASIAPGGNAVVTFMFIIDNTSCAVGVDPYLNFAYINEADTPNGTVTEDFDGDFGPMTANELATMPNMPGDNNTTNTNDTQVGSQDDADPANLEFFDLALIKTISGFTPAGPLTLNSVVTYEICIINQGSIDADEITISDYIPAGLMFDPMLPNNSNWTLSGGIASTICNGTELGADSKLDFNEQACKVIDLRFVPGQNNYVNVAEISGATGLVADPMGGFNTTPFTSDNDGDFDDNPSNDAGGQPGSAADDVIMGNGLGMIGDANAATDEDDADPAILNVIDLALRKIIAPSQPRPYKYGDNITFEIEVFNQGYNTTAANILITDYIPAGFTLNDLNWSAGPLATRTIAGPIAPGASVFTTITLTMLSTGTSMADYTNHAEISGADITDFSGNLLSYDDIDSDPDNNPTNDNGANATNVLNNPADNVITGTGGTPMAAGTNALTDEDDADPAFVPVHDVALIKTVASTGPYDPGDLVTFTITVINQGNTGLDSIKITDYIPAGYTFSVADGANTATGWMASGSNACLTKKLGSGLVAAIPSGGSVSYPITLKISPAATFTNLQNIAEVTGSRDLAGLTQADDVDSDPTTTGGQETATDDSTNGDGMTTDEDGIDGAAVLLNLYDIGSFVFSDTDNDGLYEPGAGEVGLDGITVLLYADFNMDGIPDDGPIATTVTVNGGTYLFDSLAAGNYIVGVVPPSGQATKSSDPTVTTDDMGANDNRDHGTYDSGINVFLSPSINLSLGDETETEPGPGGSLDNTNNGGTNGDMTIDFGLVPLVSIGSTVWADNNNDGLLNNSEPSLSGITVNLYADTDGNGVPDGPAIATTMTDMNGNYLFDSLLVGKYIVSVIPTASYQLSSTSTPTTVAYEADSEVDNNDNGIQSAAGAEIFSTTIDLTVDGEPTETGANPGATQDDVDDNNGDMTVDFGLIPYVSIGSTVFYDPNNDGVQQFTNPQEAGIAGVTVHLVSDTNGDGSISISEAANFIETVVTDAMGNYLFDSLVPGLYAVVVVPSTSAPLSSTNGALTDNNVDLNDDGLQPFSGFNTMSVDILLTGGAEPTETAGNPGASQDDGADTNGNMTIDFGFVPNLSIGSTVFYDRDMNGLHDFSNPLEDGIAGVTVNLYYDANNDGMINGTEATTPVYTTTTDADGNYFFGNLIPGNYQVGVTPDASAPNSSPAGVTDTADNNQDNDDNGTQSVAGGVTLSPIINLATGAEPNEDAGNPGENQDNASDLNGNMTIDFGFIPTMSIGSTVFADPNNNGIQDVGNPLEDGIAGVTVNLYYDADNDGMINGAETTPILTTTTNANGDYFFGNLPEGNYVVGVVPPGNAPVSSTPNLTADGTDGNDNGTQIGAPGSEILSNLVNLNGGSETHTETGDGSAQDDTNENNGDMTIDFGLVPNQSIGSTVFFDKNDNGLQDSNPQEFGVSGVTVQLLYDENNDGVISGAELIPVATDITDGSGDYFFGSLPSGNYQVVIPTPPAGVPMSSSPGVTDTADNNQDNDDNGTQAMPGDPITSPIINLSNNAEPLDAAENAVTGGQQDNTVANPDNNGNMTVDFGLVPMLSIGSTVFWDPNNNGAQDLANPLEDGISGVTVELWQDTNSDGVGDYLVGTDVTDADGNYFFGMLSPADYQVVVTTTSISDPVSSTGQEGDTNLENAENGAPGTGTFTGKTVSGIINLSPTAEPIESGTYPGDGQDNTADNNGNMTVDFGFVPSISIGSTVFADVNNDGMQAGVLETGIAGVTVNLYFDANNDGMIAGAELTPVAMMMTDAFGNYFFDSLPSGNFQVGIVPPTNAPTSSTPNLTDDNVDGNDNGSQPGGTGTPILSDIFNMTNGAETSAEPNQGGTQDGTAGAPDDDGNMTIDFGLVPNQSIGSTVFYDNNNDGLQNGSGLTIDQGISGVTVQLLYDNDNDPMTPMVLAGTTLTDGTGNYEFDSLPSGNYMIVIPTAPVSAPTSSTLDNVGGVTDIDSNDNGIQPGGAGTLVSSGIIVLSNEGETLTEPGQGGTQDGTPNQPDNQGDMTVDFGFAPYVSVGSNVFVDSDNNGLDDGTANEPGIAGVTVQVYNSVTNMLVGTSVTDMNGNWFVDSLLPGTYYAVINTVNPVYPTSSTTTDTNDNQEDNDDNGIQSGGSGTAVISPVFTLTGNGEPLDAAEAGPGGLQDVNTVSSQDNDGDMTIDFGFVPYFSIGNQVWIDNTSGNNASDFDGIRNGSEVGINGVTLQLVDAETGMVIQTTVTATVGTNMGMYLFDSLLPGNYIVVIPGSQMMPGGPLQDYLSSSGSFNMGGIYEGTSSIDVDDNPADNDDNGTFNTNPDYFFAVVSDTITLGVSEPLGENPDNDLITLDQYENLTVDFGFIPKVYDVALRKTTMAMIPIDAFNMQIEFMIEVFNQGNMVLDEIKVTDYIASGFGYDAAANNPLGWMLSGITAMNTISTRLNPGASTNLNIYLIVQMSNMSNAFANHAEVSQFQDTLGNSTVSTAISPYGTIEDIDSTPDSNPMNDNGSDGSSADNTADNVINGEAKDEDGNPTGGSPDDGVASTDEDDADPAIIKIVDIAQIKTLVSAGPFRYGDDVVFAIEVENQGNVPLRNIEISDYIPAGFTYNTANNANGWSLSGSTATYVIEDTLDMWETVTINITLTINKITPATDTDEDTWTNISEISAMEGMLTPGAQFIDVTGMDIDSELDDNPDNNSGGEANTDDDNNTGENGMLGEDADNSDPVLVPIYDVALTKKFVAPNAIYLFGNVIPMNIEVINQGNTDLYNVEVTDYVPASLTTTGAPANPGWTFGGVSGPTLGTYTIEGPIAPGASVIVPLSLVFQSAGTFEDYINYAEVSDFENEFGDSAFAEDIVDADSDPDRDDGNDDGGVPSLPGAPTNTDDYVDGNGYAPGGAPGQDVAAEDEDDHDPLLLGFVDLALTKVVQGSGQIEPGQPITFTITITNQGTIPSGSVTVTDYIPSGFVLDDADWTSVPGNRATKTVSVANGDFGAPGLRYLQTETIDITLRPLPATQRGAYVNYAEISGNTAPNGQDILDLDVDSDGDTNPNNDNGGNPASPDGSIVGSDNVINGTGTQTPGGVPGDSNPATDEDDADPAIVCITPRPDIVGDFFVCPGETVTYSLTEFAPGIAYFNPANRYTWSLTGPATIVGSNAGVSVTLKFDDIAGGAGGIIDLKILEETAFPFCMGMDVQRVEIEKLLPLVCENALNVSVDENCQVLVTPGMILEAQAYPDASYSIVITTLSGIPVANPVDRSQIGNTLKVSIIQDCYGQSCWGTIKIEDKLAPVIRCPEVDTIACYDPRTFSLPVAVDNCGGNPVVTLLSDVTTDLGCDPRYRAIRIIRYQAKDGSGNLSAVCERVIYYRKITLADVKFPKNYDSTPGQRPHLECDGSWAWAHKTNASQSNLTNASGTRITLPTWDKNGNNYPDPDETGAPFVADAQNITNFVLGYKVGTGPSFNPSLPECTSGNLVGYNVATASWQTSCGATTAQVQNFRIDTFYSPIIGNNNSCKINTTYSDTKLDICPKSFKILRAWTVLDWCSGI